MKIGEVEIGMVIRISNNYHNLLVIDVAPAVETGRIYDDAEKHTINWHGRDITPFNWYRPDGSEGARRKVVMVELVDGGTVFCKTAAAIQYEVPEQSLLDSFNSEKANRAEQEVERKIEESETAFKTTIAETIVSLSPKMSMRDAGNIGYYGVGGVYRSLIEKDPELFEGMVLLYLKYLWQTGGKVAGKGGEDIESLVEYFRDSVKGAREIALTKKARVAAARELVSLTAESPEWNVPILIDGKKVAA